MPDAVGSPLSHPGSVGAPLARSRHAGTADYLGGQSIIDI